VTARYQAFVRVDGVIASEFQDPSFPADVVERRNGVGEHQVKARITDRAVSYLTDEVDGQKVWRTWDTHHVEIEVRRDGEIVAVGPVVDVGHEPGWVTFVCWSREAYIVRTVIGPASRTNLFPQGYFDGSLTGWTTTGSAVIEAVTDVTYTQPFAMKLTGSGTAPSYVVLDAPTYRNVVHGLVVARWSGGNGWPVDLNDQPVVGQWEHFTQPIGGALTDLDQRRAYGVVLPPDAVEGSWYRHEVPMPEYPGVENIYVFTPQTTDASTAWIGEAEIVRSENVSVRAGNDRALLVRSLYNYLTEDILPDGWDWETDLTGELMSDAVRYDFDDHRDTVAALRDQEPHGDWRVDRGTHTIRWGQLGQQRPNLSCVWTDLTTPSARWDAKEASTEVITLADGQDGPLREESFARREGTPHRLMRVESARPLGLPPKELRGLAERLLEQEGPALVTVSGTPALGPMFSSELGPPLALRRDLPGAWWTQSECGDWFSVRVVDPPDGSVIDYTVTPKIQERRLSIKDDTMSVTVEAVRAA